MTQPRNERKQKRLNLSKFYFFFIILFYSNHKNSYNVNKNKMEEMKNLSIRDTFQ